MRECGSPGARSEIFMKIRTQVSTKERPRMSLSSRAWVPHSSSICFVWEATSPGNVWIRFSFLSGSLLCKQYPASVFCALLKTKETMIL